MNVAFPPGAHAGPRPWVFLAGSIDQGRAEPWQDRVADALRGRAGTLLNPRRPEWNASWRQSIDEPKFREQVEWELEGLEQADVVAMYPASGSQAPISLLELGCVARSGRLVVACAPDFWRRGNVEVVSHRHGVPLHEDLEALIEAIGRALD